MKEHSPILCITHELDGDWQFMGRQPITNFIKTALIVNLDEIINYDASVLEVAELPMGYCATRNSLSDKWVFSKIDYDSEEIKSYEL